MQPPWENQEGCKVSAIHKWEAVRLHTSPNAVDSQAETAARRASAVIGSRESLGTRAPSWAVPDRLPYNFVFVLDCSIANPTDVRTLARARSHRCL